MVLRYDLMRYQESFGQLIEKIAFLQMKILKDYRIPIRGAITKGQIYLDDKIVFGSGLIKVENLERTEAQYPRIILDESISNIINNVDSILIKKDFDDKYYIDFFSAMKLGNIYTPKPEEKKTICKMRDSVHYLVERYGHYDNRFKDRIKIDETGKTILKYLWLVEKYNEFVKDRKIPVKISYQVSINPKFFKFELNGIEKNSWPVVVN